MADRLLAKALDLLIFTFLASVLPHPFGVLCGLAYVGLADGISGGASIGKRWRKLEVVMLDASSRGDFEVESDPVGDPRRWERAPRCDARQSLVRNAPLGLILVFVVIPFWGWVLAFFLGVPLLALEGYLMATRPGGVRLGDSMAGTRVLSRGGRL